MNECTTAPTQQAAAAHGDGAGAASRRAERRRDDSPAPRADPARWREEQAVRKMSEPAVLRARLFKIEALLARPGHEGERIAAKAAVERIRERLDDMRRAHSPFAPLFPLSVAWTEDLLALLERQRLAADSLYRSQMAWAYGAHCYARAVLWPGSQALARFWGAGERDTESQEADSER